MKKIIVLGGNILNGGFRLKKQEYGIEEVCVVDWNKSPAYPGDLHIQLDIKDYQAIWKRVKNWEEVLCIYTSADVGVPSQVRLHKKIGLLAPSDKALKNVAAKGQMAECWKRDRLQDKESMVIETSEEFIPNSANAYIFKPNASSSSRGITILSKDMLTKEHIANACEKARQMSLDGKVIVEEFCEGTEYTVEMLGDNWGNVAVYGISKKYHTQFNKFNKVAVKLHYNPEDVSDGKLDEIAKFAQCCYRSLGLTNSFGHFELICCRDGRIVPVELGARSSGYAATHLVDAISRDCFIKKYSEVIRGGKMKDGICFERDKSSMYFFYNLPECIAKREANLAQYLDNGIEVLDYDRRNLVKGNKFSVVDSDSERPGFEILCGNRESLTISRIAEAEKNFMENFI